ncbi:hypothetical protein Hanom_Chr03g00205071 [Helianthus anomalus]
MIYDLGVFFFFGEKLFRTSYVCPMQTMCRHLSLQCVCFLEDLSLKKVCMTSFWCRHGSTSSWVCRLSSPPHFENTENFSHKNPSIFSSILILLPPRPTSTAAIDPRHLHNAVNLHPLHNVVDLHHLHNSHRAPPLHNSHRPPPHLQLLIPNF